MSKTFYGFQVATGRCIFSASGPVEPQEDVVVIEGDGDLDIMQITFEADDNGARIVPREKTTEELVAEAIGKKETLMEEARRRIDILRDMADLNGDEQAAALLLEWRKYRLAVMAVSVAVPTEIVWPEKPLA